MTKTVNGKVKEKLAELTVKEETTVELARKVLATTPPVREDLVNEIKGKIKDGSYQVAPETVAQNIIAHLDENR